MNLNLRYYNENLENELSENDREIIELIESGKTSEEILSSNLNVNTYFNFSKVKQNLLNWYDFRENSSILQIGILSKEINKF